MVFKRNQTANILARPMRQGAKQRMSWVDQNRNYFARWGNEQRYVAGCSHDFGKLILSDARNTWQRVTLMRSCVQTDSANVAAAQIMGTQGVKRVFLDFGHLQVSAQSLPLQC